jgi:Trehalose utilisation
MMNPKGMLTGIAMGLIATGAAHAAVKAVLIFDRFGTNRFNHTQGIRDGNALIDSLGKAHNFTVTISDIESFMTYDNMKKFDVIVFNNNVGEALTIAAGQDAFIRYMNEGGGYVGFHGAMDHHQYWKWYTDMGVDFNGHTGANAMVKVDDAAGAKKPEYADIIKVFPKVPWEWREEWYAFKTNPRSSGADILMTVDEKTFVNSPIDPQQVMGDHAIAWAKRLPALAGSTKQGRYFYTLIGHGGYGVNGTHCFKNEPYVNEFVYQALRWAGGEKDSATTVAVNPAKALSGIRNEAISVSSSRLEVSVSENGPHRVEIFSTKGRLVESVRGNGPMAYEFAVPQGQSVYVVKIAAAKHIHTKRVYAQ